MAGYIRLPRDFEDSNDDRVIGVGAESPVHSKSEHDSATDSSSGRVRGANLGNVLRVIASFWSVLTLIVTACAAAFDGSPAIHAGLTAVILATCLNILVWQSLAASGYFAKLDVCEHCSARTSQPARRSNWFYRWFIFPADGLVTLFVFATSVPVLVDGVSHTYQRTTEGAPGLMAAAGALLLFLSVGQLALWIAGSWPNMRIEFQFDPKTSGSHPHIRTPSVGGAPPFEPAPEMQSSKA